MVKTVRYNNREEMVTAIRHAMERKREWIKKTDRQFAAIRQQKLVTE